MSKWPSIPMTPEGLLSFGLDATFPTDGPVPEPIDPPPEPQTNCSPGPACSSCPSCSSCSLITPFGPPNALYNLERMVRGAKGDPGKDGKDGASGQDGFSPQIRVEEITGGHEVTVVDRYGTTHFIVDDGDDYVLTPSDRADIANLVVPRVDRITNLELEEMLR